MLDKHEFKIAWVLISHCTLSTSFKQKFPWNVKEFQLRQIKKNIIKMWRREMQISSPTSRSIWYIFFPQMTEVKCGILITFLKQLVYSVIVKHVKLSSQAIVNLGFLNPFLFSVLLSICDTEYMANTALGQIRNRNWWKH